MIRLGFASALALTILTGCGETPDYRGDAAKLVASRWGVDGAAACTVRVDQMKAVAREYDFEHQIPQIERVEQIVLMIADEASNQFGWWASYSALRKFKKEHADDDANEIQTGWMICSDDIISGAQDSQRGVRPSTDDEQKSNDRSEVENETDPSKHVPSQPQRVESDPNRLSEEDLRRTHTPFSELMDGRWATEGRSCDDNENMMFDVVAGTFQRGQRSGTFTFEDMLLSMRSAKGDSVGRVTVLDPETIQIDWVDWKPVKYSRC